MPVAVMNIYKSLNDFYRQQVDDFILAIANQQKISSQQEMLVSSAKVDVDLDFLISDSHTAPHFSVPQKWTRDELYDRGCK